MHLNQDSKLAPAVKSLFLFIACLSLAALTVTGCSKPEKKAPVEKKEVVTTMNIKKDGGEPAKAKEPAKPAVEEIESLPMEPADEEEEMPDLGSGN